MGCGSSTQQQAAANAAAGSVEQRATTAVVTVDAGVAAATKAAESAVTKATPAAEAAAKKAVAGAVAAVGGGKLSATDQEYVQTIVSMAVFLLKRLTVIVYHENDALTVLAQQQQLVSYFDLAGGQFISTFLRANFSQLKDTYTVMHQSKHPDYPCEQHFALLSDAEESLSYGDVASVEQCIKQLQEAVRQTSDHLNKTIELGSQSKDKSVKKATKHLVFMSRCLGVFDGDLLTDRTLFEKNMESYLKQTAQ